MALEAAASMHKLPSYIGAIGPEFAHPHPSSVPAYHFGIESSSQPRLSKAKNRPVAFPGAVYGSLPYKLFGYPLGSVLGKIT